MARKHVGRSMEADLNAAAVKDLLKIPENKTCFECPAKMPYYVDLHTQAFVCARCSGLLREVGHRIKSISSSVFTQPEVIVLRLGGNKAAAATWLSGYSVPEDEYPPTFDSDLRIHLRKKYVERLWLDERLLRERFEYVQKVLNDDSLQPGPQLKTQGPQSTPPNARPSGKENQGDLLLLDLTDADPSSTPSSMHSQAFNSPALSPTHFQQLNASVSPGARLSSNPSTPTKFTRVPSTPMSIDDFDPFSSRRG